MAIATGCDGYIKVPAGTGSTATAIGYVDNASVKINNQIQDKTGLGQKWAQNESTLRSWSVDCSGSLDLADTAQKVLYDLMFDTDRIPGVTIALSFDGTNTISGSGILSNINISEASGGVAKWSASFTGNGAPTAA